MPVIMALPAQDPEVGRAEGEGRVPDVGLDVVDDGGGTGHVDAPVACAASASCPLDGGSTCRLPFPGQVEPMLGRGVAHVSMR